jgi:exosortase A
MLLPMSLEAPRCVTSREAGVTQPAVSWTSAYIILGGCLVFVVGIHRATVASILQTWSQDPFAHGYFVVPAAAYLAWSRRERVQSMNLRPAPAALPFLAFLSFLWLLGNLIGSAEVQQFCVVTMFVAVTWAVLGTAPMRFLIFPLGLLVFALPFGPRLAPALQELTARFALTMLTLSGVHPVLEGHVISIADTRWTVTPACGGINYLVASLAVGYLYAGAVYRQWSHRVAFLAASALVPLAANGLRVYTTILLDHLGATRVAAGMGHYLYGILVFSIVMSILFTTCGRWGEEPASADDSMSSLQRPDTAPAAMRRIALCAAAGLLLVVIGPVSATALWLEPAPEETIPRHPPAVLLPWKAVDAPFPAWSPSFVTPQAQFLQAYKAGDHVVMLYVAQYGANQPDVKLASGSNPLYDEPWWSAGERPLTIAREGKPVQVNERLLRSPGSALRVWHWYEIDRSFTGDVFVARLLVAKARLFRSREGFAAVAVATEERPGVDAAAVLREFVGRVSPSTSASATRSYSRIRTAALAEPATASATAPHNTTR